MRKNVSVVITLFNEEKSLKELYQRLKKILENLGTYEIIFVDDGSQDNSFSVLKELHGQDKNIKVIQFWRNFGKSAALDAGFRSCQGEIGITMDADLQDIPEEIPNLIAKLKQGYDLVSGWRVKRNDRFAKRLSSIIFNRIISLLTKIKIHDLNCGLKAYRREVIDHINIYGELHRFIPLLAQRQGFRVGEVEIIHHPRKYGTSKFNSLCFISGFFDFLSTLFITTYTTKPLHYFGVFGLLSFLMGFSINLLLIIWKFTIGLIILAGRPLLALILGIFLMLVGLQFFSLGLISELMISTFTGRRVTYLIKNRLEE